MKLMKPIAAQFSGKPLSFLPSQKRVRHLSEMAGLFADAQATNEMIAAGDPVIYEMHMADVPQTHGHLLHSVTVMHPGKVGNEYFITAGHFHQDLQASEVYYCLGGEGFLLVQSKDGACEYVSMKQGTVAYIPPGWAHRTVNCGKDDFVFLAVWPGDAGHDYESIRKSGFAKIVVERNGTAQLLPNQKYRQEK